MIEPQGATRDHTERMLRSFGVPVESKTIERNGVTIEKWVYKETTWDQGGWSWNRTVSDSAVVFQNGRVVSFGVEKGETFANLGPSGLRHA